MIGWIIGTMFAMLAVYGAVHYVFPSWGTIVTNAMAGLGLAVDAIAGLPWGTVLEPKEAATIAFGIAAANVIMRLNGPKQAVGQG